MNNSLSVINNESKRVVIPEIMEPIHNHNLGRCSTCVNSHFGSSNNRSLKNYFPPSIEEKNKMRLDYYLATRKGQMGFLFLLFLVIFLTFVGMVLISFAIREAFRLLKDLFPGLAPLLDSIQRLLGNILIYADPLVDTLYLLDSWSLTSHMMNELNNYTGGFIHSVEQVTTVSGRNVRGDQISKGELIYDTLFVAAAAATVATGGTAYAAYASQEAKQGVLGQTALGRTVLDIVTAASFAAIAGGDWANAMEKSAVQQGEVAGATETIKNSDLGDTQAGRYAITALFTAVGSGVMGENAVQAQQNLAQSTAKNTAQIQIAKQLSGVPGGNLIARNIANNLGNLDSANSSNLGIDPSQAAQAVQKAMLAAPDAFVGLAVKLPGAVATTIVNTPSAVVSAASSAANAVTQAPSAIASGATSAVNAIANSPNAITQGLSNLMNLPSELVGAVGNISAGDAESYYDALKLLMQGWQDWQQITCHYVSHNVGGTYEMVQVCKKALGRLPIQYGRHLYFFEDGTWWIDDGIWIMLLMLGAGVFGLGLISSREQG